MATIVILDDSPTNRSIYARLASLVEDAVVAETFADPLDALEWLENNGADLVITDFKMPGMDGAAFTSRLRAIPAMAAVPVLVVTAHDDRSFRVRALDAGATDFLQSPIDHFEFVTRARNLLALGRRGMDGAAPFEPAAATAAVLDGAAVLALAAPMQSARLAAAPFAGFARILDAVPALISATDRAGDLVYANAAFAAAFGARPADLLGRGVLALLGDGAGTERLAVDRRVFETGAAMPVRHEMLAEAGGAARALVTARTPLRDAAGEIVAVLTTAFPLPGEDRERPQPGLHP